MEESPPPPRYTPLVSVEAVQELLAGAAERSAAAGEPGAAAALRTVAGNINRLNTVTMDNVPWTVRVVETRRPA